VAIPAAICERYALPYKLAVNYQESSYAFEHEDEDQFHRNFNISPDIICQISLMDSRAIVLLEKHVGLLQFKDDTLLGFSKQYEALQQTRAAASFE